MTAYVLSDELITPDRHPFAVGAIGGPTVVIDYGGLRFVTDPTFDPPGNYGGYQKTEGPACTPADIGRFDAILLSHDLHWDNFDHAGRAFACDAPLILTGHRSAARLGRPALGLDDFDSCVVGAGGNVRVTSVPAQHGPRDGDRDEDGNVNTEVHGFILQSTNLPTVYLSGDNAGIEPAVSIGAAFPNVDVAVLHCGAARIHDKNASRPLTLTAARATDVALILGAHIIVPVHHQGWSIYSENIDDVAREFEEAGLSARLIRPIYGRWAVTGDTQQM